VREFSREGVAGARTDAIARAAGVNKALLYYYFKDKETLYGAVLDQVFGGLSKSINEALSRDLPPREKLLAYVGAHFDYIASHPLYPRITQSEMMRAARGNAPQLKRIAKRAGLICGQCQSTLTKADRYGVNKRQEVVCCADDCQVCEQHYLHRLRKTAATIWHNTGVPLRTIQKWLGHKSIETTMIYLGVQDSDELQEQINVRKY